MAINRGPKIVTDGLILCQDFADENCVFSKTNTNLLNYNNWLTGSGSATGNNSFIQYNRNGDISEISRFYSGDPFNNSSIIWQCASAGDAASNGGWDTNYFNIDNSKTYRFSVWAKRSVLGDGNIYLGTNSQALSGATTYGQGVFTRTSTQVQDRLITPDITGDFFTCSGHGLVNSTFIQIYTPSGSGGSIPGGLSQYGLYYARNITTDTFQVSTTTTGSIIDITSSGSGPLYVNGYVNSNPYFFAGTPATYGITQGNWYLLVGHVWYANAGSGSRHPDSALYNISGTKISFPNDFVWTTKSARTNHRAYLFYATNPATRQEFYDPRVDVLDGNQPSISDLISNNPYKVKNLVSNQESVLINHPSYSVTNGGEYLFDGSGNRADTIDNISFGNNTTWEAWINRTSSIASHNMFMGRFLPYFSARSSNFFFFSNIISGVQRSIASSSAPIQNNTWCHFCATNEYNTGTQQTTMNMYFNGSKMPLTDVNVFSGFQSNFAYKFSIGDGTNTLGSPWAPFNGKVAAVKIYNKVLTDAEIKQNYNALKSRFGLS